MECFLLKIVNARQMMSNIAINVKTKIPKIAKISERVFGGCVCESGLNS